MYVDIIYIIANSCCGEVLYFTQDVTEGYLPKYDDEIKLSTTNAGPLPSKRKLLYLIFPSLRIILSPFSYNYW